VIAAVLLVARRASWRIVALVAAAVSAPVIGLASGQAIAGLVIDGVVLIGVAAGIFPGRDGEAPSGKSEGKIV
jgi:hypothetical protein